MATQLAKIKQKQSMKPPRPTISVTQCQIIAILILITVAMAVAGVVMAWWHGAQNCQIPKCAHLGCALPAQKLQDINVC